MKTNSFSEALAELEEHFADLERESENQADRIEELEADNASMVEQLAEKDKEQAG